jgi:hypothetical protein
MAPGGGLEVFVRVVQHLVGGDDLVEDIQVTGVDP